jgi:ABC-2 type transport system ATP-binding protein
MDGLNAQALALRHLRKVYANGLEALRGIDLDVPSGDFFALLGPNGAGKSTTIGIVTSLVTKTAGTVEVFGFDLDRDPESVKAQIGLVPQEFNFNQFEPAIEIVVNQAGYYGIPRREAYAKAREVLSQLDLWDRRDTEARRLSGGLKRRLMIARALAHRPRLLILDEPTAGVDIEIRRAMWAFLRETNTAGTTIILTTHYLEEAESLCRHIAIINGGEIVERAAMRDLLRRLHTETFVLNVSGDLGRLSALDAYDIHVLDEDTLEVSVRREEGLNRLFAALSAVQVEVLSLRNKQNRLEQLFLGLLDGGAPRRR